MARFEADLQLECPPETVFNFLIDPENLAKISPPELGFHLVRWPAELQIGSQVEFQLHGLGPVQHCIHEITDLEPPYRLTERQLKGPLKHFVHEHVIEGQTDHQCWVMDRIEFQPPGGMVGLVFNEGRIRTALQASIDHKHRELKRHLEPESS